MNSEMLLRIEEILKENNIHKEGEQYQVDIYADYRDSLEHSSLVKIGEQDKETVREEFYSYFQEDEAIFEEQSHLVKLIKDDLSSEVENDELMEWVEENVSFNFPYDHYLKQSVCVNVSVETGESNYDYTLNNLVECSQGKHWKLSNEGSLVWLAKQQGYNKVQAKKAIKNPGSIESKFLKSIFEESNNVTTHMNQLVFFVRMSLGEYIDLKEDPREFVVSRNTRCGLVDFWNGAGSILDIQLEKNVLIPAKKLTMHIDGAVGHSVGEIYGLLNSFWK